MRRDSIFYQIFQRSPTTLFNLIPHPPNNAEAYRFDSVAVKEPRFEIDGVFLPPDDTLGTVYFCELQMQKDEQLYERIFSESFLYFYRNRPRFSDLQIVVICPSRQTEQNDLHPHRSLLNGNQVDRIYLDELGDIQHLPLWVGVLALTTVKKETQTIQAAQELVTRARQEAPADSSRAIIEVVATILWYRFQELSRQQIEAMLDITIQESRVYQEGRQEGRQEGEASIVLRLLDKRFGDLSEELRKTVSELPLLEIEDLAEALLDFSTLTDLQNWLSARSR
ncbi:MAG: DUF2887 domain-containing protein [Phormidesmis sp.]